MRAEGQNTPQAQAQVSRMLETLATIQGLVDSLEADLRGPEEVWKSDVELLEGNARLLKLQAASYMGEG